jgi:hypothetical protein
MFAYLGGASVITLPDGVTSIGYRAFSGCTSLVNVTIPDGVLSIGAYAFSSCTGLTTITIPGSVKDIGTYAFAGCLGLTAFTIPGGVISIGERAFVGCNNLITVTVADANTAYKDIDGVLFSKNGDTIIFYPRGKTGAYVIPDGVTTVGDFAFYRCTGLTGITMGNDITSIALCAFDGCAGLTSIIIPVAVTSIGAQALYACTNLTQILMRRSDASQMNLSDGWNDINGILDGGVIDPTWGYTGG